MVSIDCARWKNWVGLIAGEECDKRRGLRMMDKQIARLEKELDFICNKIIRNLERGIKNGINEQEFWRLVNL